MKILNRLQIREAENAAAFGGVSFSELMKRAAASAYELINEKYSIKNSTVTVVCGKGNNGGDGVLLAEKLHREGAFVNVYFPCGEPHTETFMPYTDILDTLNKVDAVPKECDFLIDALFGIGLCRELSGIAAQSVKEMNECRAKKIAIDLPSGIDCDGKTKPEIAFKADFSVTFIAYKPCFFLPITSSYCGEVAVCDLGIEAENYSYKTIEKPYIDKRDKNSHKGTFGTALLLCGSYGMCGAEILAAKSALACGVGIAKAFVCDKNYTAFCVSVPEAVTIPVETSISGVADIYDKQMLTELSGASSLLVGCGLGTCDDAVQLVKRFLEATDIPVVIDADGINNIVDDINILRRVNAPVVITPHPKEMARLCRTTVADIEMHRVDYAKKIAVEYGCTVVLKGANTIIASKRGEIYFNTTGNAGMATGGTGDVLAGMIVSYLAQGLDAFDAARVAVYLHGEAADDALEYVNEAALSPLDIITELIRHR